MMLAILCAATSGVVRADESPAVDTAEANTEAVQDAAVERRRDDLLDRLKRRSGRDRWQDVRDELPADDRAGQAADDPRSTEALREATRKPAFSFDRGADVVPLKSPQPVPDFGMDVSVPYPLERRSEPQPFPLYPDNGIRMNEPLSARSFAADDDEDRDEDDDRDDGEPNRSSVKTKSISEILPYLDYASDTRDPLPEDDSVGFGEGIYGGRDYSETMFNWEASNVYHNPLYFEDAPLERYGHVHHHLLQPFVSTGRFAGQIVMLPYQMTIDPITKKRYTLGWFRPGECAPRKRYQVPFNGKATAVQAAVTTGLIFLIP